MIRVTPDQVELFAVMAKEMAPNFRALGKALAVAVGVASRKRQKDQALLPDTYKAVYRALAQGEKAWPRMSKSMKKTLEFTVTQAENFMNVPDYDNIRVEPKPRVVKKIILDLAAWAYVDSSAELVRRYLDIGRKHVDWAERVFLLQGTSKQRIFELYSNVFEAALLKQPTLVPHGRTIRKFLIVINS